MELQKGPVTGVYPGTKKFPHLGTQEAMKTPSTHLDPRHVFGLE